MDPAAVQLYAWARAQTSKDALFFFPDLAFRYYARRSITHAWKDLSAAIYTRGRLHAEWTRFSRYEHARRDPTTLVELARAERIDYIVRYRDEATLPLPVAYENWGYLVYRVAR